MLGNLPTASRAVNAWKPFDRHRKIDVSRAMARRGCPRWLVAMALANMAVVIRLSGGREQVRAVVPTAAERLLLAIPDDTAALAIDRCGHLRGTPVEWRQTVVRGDRFSLITDLGRTDQTSVTVSDRIVPTTWSPS